MDARSFYRWALAYRALASRRHWPSAIVIAALFATFCGCQTALHWNAARDPLTDAAVDPKADSPPVEPVTAQTATAGAPAATAPAPLASAPTNRKLPGVFIDHAMAAAANNAAGAASLADDRWVQAVPTLEEPTPKYRWRHFGLEGWMARGTWQAEVTAALADSQPIVATNAAILAARGGSTDEQIVKRLTLTIETVNLRLPLRYAAVEALAQVPAASARGELGRLADQQIQFMTGTPSAYMPEMHAELLRGLSESPAPADAAADNPRFVAALASSAPDARRAALTAWLDPKRQRLPPAALELRRDPDPLVRATALAVLAVQRPKPAETLLLAALDDTDLSVRIAAIGALGKLGTPAGRAALEKLRTHSHEAARVAAVEALGKAAGYRAVIVSAQDKSWKVRRAVAESLSLAGQNGESIDAETAKLARALVGDPSLEVQRRMLDSLAAWPLEQAGDVLLAAMAEGGYQTRKDAAVQLAKRWPAGAEFPVEAPPAERATSIATLTERWKIQFPATAHSASDQPAASTTLPPEKLARLRQLILLVADQRTVPSVRQQAVDTLVSFGPALPPALEATVAADDSELPEPIYLDVLSKISPVFAALADLASPDVRLRRNAASQFVAALAGKPMSQLALDRLVALARYEEDPVVWQCLLQTTAGDPRSGAEQLAYLAVGNSSSDVRRRACDYLAAHPDRRHVPVLMPMLGDPISTVAIAAVHALGTIGKLDDLRPLVDLLLTSDRPLRLEVATTLVRLKSDAGRAALERMAREPDMQLRLEVARRMGEVGDVCFLPTLIQTAAEPNDVGRVALESLTKLTSQDFSRDEDGSLRQRDAQVSLWQAWQRKQQLAEAAAPLGPTVPLTPQSQTIQATFTEPAK
jgi:HEAT repeat protein